MCWAEPPCEGEEPPFSGRGLHAGAGLHVRADEGGEHAVLLLQQFLRPAGLQNVPSLHHNHQVCCQDGVHPVLGDPHTYTRLPQEGGSSTPRLPRKKGPHTAWLPQERRLHTPWLPWLPRKKGPHTMVTMVTTEERTTHTHIMADTNQT